MRRLTRSIALAALIGGCLAPGATAMPSPYPSYFNRAAPTLGDGVHGAAPGTGTGTPGTAPSSSRCNAAKRSVTRAKRKVRSLKRRLRRARSRSRKRKLRRAIRIWNRKVRGRRRTMRRRCAGIARAGNADGNRAATFARGRAPRVRAPARKATSAGGAYFRAGVISCDPGHMHMYAGPDMRSQGDFIQGVAFRVVLYRWNGSSWVYNNEFGDYWWGSAGPSSPPFTYYDSADEWRFNDQGFFINVPGTYRFAVRYHWWANTAGGRQDTSWNWAGIHQSNGIVQQTCTYV